MNYFSRKNVFSIAALITFAPLAHAMDGSTTPKNKLEEIIEKLVAHSALLMQHFGPNPEASYLLNIAASNGNQAAIDYFGTVNAEYKLHVQRHRIFQGHDAFTKLCQSMRFNAIDTDADLVAYRWFNAIIDDEFTPGAGTEEIVGDAAFMIGSLCQMQRGIPQKLANKESAKIFFEIAAQHGNKSAQDRLAELGIQWQAPQPLQLTAIQTETLPVAPVMPATTPQCSSQQTPQLVTPVISEATSQLVEETFPQQAASGEQLTHEPRIINATIYLKADPETKTPSNTAPAQEEIKPSQTTAQHSLPAKKVKPEHAKIKSADTGKIAESILANIANQKACHATKQVIHAAPKSTSKKPKSSKKQKAPAKKIKNIGDITTAQVQIEQIDRKTTIRKERDDAFQLLSGLLTHFTQSPACKTIAASLKQMYKQYATATDLYNYAYCQLQKKNVQQLSELEGMLLYLQGKFAAAQDKLSNIPICFDRNLMNWYLAHAIFNTTGSAEPSAEIIKQIVSALESATLMPIKEAQNCAKLLKLDHNMINFLQEHSSLGEEPDSTILTILSRIGIMFGHDVIGHEKDSISVMLEDLTEKSYANGRLCLAEMYLYGIGTEKSIDKALEKLQEAINAPDKTVAMNEMIEKIVLACTDFSAKVGELAQLKIPYLILIHDIKTKNLEPSVVVERFKKTESMVSEFTKKGINAYNLIKETGLYDILLAKAKDSPAIAQALAHNISIRIIENEQLYSAYAEALDIAIGHIKHYTPTDDTAKNREACVCLHNIGAAKRAAGLPTEALELFDRASYLVEKSSEEFKRALFEIAITHCTGKAPNFAQGIFFLIKLAEDSHARDHYLLDDLSMPDKELLDTCEKDLITAQGLLNGYNDSQVETRRATLAKLTNDNLFYFAKSMIGYAAKQKTSKDYSNSKQFWGLVKKASNLENQNAAIIVEKLISFIKL